MLLDGWSYAGLVADFLAAYEALREGRAPRLPARRPYRDYIAWLANLGAAAAARAEAYWRAALAGWSEPTPIPADRRPGAHAAGAAAAGPAGIGSVELPLTAAETARLQEGARRRQLTLSTLAQAAWGLLLARYGAPEDVVFGVTVSGRPAELPGVEGILGLFINSLPVRLSIAAEAPLGPWLAGLHRRAAELRQHEHTPLVRIQGWSEVPGGLPLFESLLVFENYPRDAALARAGSSLGIAAVESIEQTSYPLTVVALPAESLRLRIDYDRARFDGTTARRLVGHLRTLLLAVGQAADDLPLGDLPLLSAAERQQVCEWNATAAAFPPLGLADLFAARAARFPEAPALAADGREVSYRELERRAARLARRLAALGIGPETPVALCLPRTPEMVVASLAVLLSGGAYVPLDPAYPPERLAWIAGDVAAPVVLVPAGAERAGFAWAGAARLVEVGAEGRSERTEDAAAATGAADTGADLPGRGIDDRRLAYVMYTSGSTGRPKGVAVTQRAVHRLVRHTDYVRLRPGDRVAQVANPAFDAATFEIWGALLNGGCLVFLPQSVLLSPPDLARALAQERVSTMFLTSALFHQVARQAPRAFAPLRELLFGGEAADPRLVRAVLAAGPPARLLHVYGPTETTTFATWHAVREVAPGAASVPIGGPVGNAVARVLDRELRELPVGAVGELCIGGWTGGEGLARGYFGRPELTAERFVPDPCSDAAEGGLGARLYRTGDLVRRLADGAIDFLGRLDRQVKLRGFRIEPGEIEAALAEHPRVRQAAVAVRQVGEGDRRLVAYVAAEPAPGAVPDAETGDAETGDAEAGSPGVIDPGELRAFLETRLPPYMVPAGFVFLGSLPLTATGKVDRRALAAGPAQEWGSRAGRVHLPPRTAAEAALASIWAEVLRLDAAAGPSVEDDFFALGGDSILSIQIVARARQAGLAITPRQLFENPTIAGLAAVAASVDARAAAESAADGEESAAAGPVPLTPVQRWFFAQGLARPHHFDQAVLLALPEAGGRSPRRSPRGSSRPPSPPSPPTTAPSRCASRDATAPGCRRAPATTSPPMPPPASRWRRSTSPASRREPRERSRRPPPASRRASIWRTGRSPAPPGSTCPGAGGGCSSPSTTWRSTASPGGCCWKTSTPPAGGSWRACGRRCRRGRRRSAASPSGWRRARAASPRRRSPPTSPGGASRPSGRRPACRSIGRSEERTPGWTAARTPSPPRAPSRSPSTPRRPPRCCARCPPPTARGSTTSCSRRSPPPWGAARRLRSTSRGTAATPCPASTSRAPSAGSPASPRCGWRPTPPPVRAQPSKRSRSSSATARSGRRATACCAGCGRTRRLPSPPCRRRRSASTTWASSTRRSPPARSSPPRPSRAARRSIPPAGARIAWPSPARSPAGGSASTGPSAPPSSTAPRSRVGRSAISPSCGGSSRTAARRPPAGAPAARRPTSRSPASTRPGSTRSRPRPPRGSPTSTRSRRSRRESSSMPSTRRPRASTSSRSSAPWQAKSMPRLSRGPGAGWWRAIRSSARRSPGRASPGRCRSSTPRSRCASSARTGAAFRPPTTSGGWRRSSPPTASAASTSRGRRSCAGAWCAPAPPSTASCGATTTCCSTAGPTRR